MCLSEFICTICISVAHRVQKMVLDPQRSLDNCTPPPYGCWRRDPGSMEEQPVLFLTPEPMIQPLCLPLSSRDHPMLFMIFTLKNFAKIKIKNKIIPKQKT